MKLAGKNAVVTGAAGGIGRAIAERYLAEGARAVTIADLPSSGVLETAANIGAHPFPCDVTAEAEIQALVRAVEEAHGPVDVFVSNAGISRRGTEHAPDEDWQLNWDVHVMAHVYAARAVAAGMAERGDGYLVNTSSAAGLLTHINSATYAVSKHAAVAFAEYLAINYGARGVKVSVLCPQAVRTAMTQGREGTVASVDGMLEPDVLAECVVETMDREEFLILPHPEVLDYMRRKTSDYDRWLRGMQRLKGKFDEAS